jgi:DeoR family transcriptional regulator of aga operon
VYTLDRRRGQGFGVEGLPADARRQRIAAALEERDFVRVSDLSAELGISEVTVRSDLTQLARSGLVHRVHGGAVKVQPRREGAFEEMESTQAEEKRLIAREAAALVTAGESLILDVGTTTAALARALIDSRPELAGVVVFTNGLNIALLLEAAVPRFTVVVTGGTLRPLQHSLVDPLGGLIFEQLQVSTAFIGCNGVDAGAGVTNLNLPEAEMKRRMLRNAERRVVLADGSKVGQVTLARLCGVEDVDLVITGASADPRALDELRERGVTVVVAAEARADDGRQPPPGGSVAA